MIKNSSNFKEWFGTGCTGWRAPREYSRKTFCHVARKAARVDHVVRIRWSRPRAARSVIDGAAAPPARDAGMPCVTAKPALVPELLVTPVDAVSLVAQHGRDGWRNLLLRTATANGWGRISSYFSVWARVLIRAMPPISWPISAPTADIWRANCPNHIFAAATWESETEHQFCGIRPRHLAPG